MTVGTFGKDYISRALSYFPPRIVSAVKSAANGYEGKELNEIRAVRGAELSLLIAGRIVGTGVVMRDEEMRRTVMALCGNSVYSHSETIKDGYIITSDGMRAGICGRAVCEKNAVLSVIGADAIVIRIPSRHPGFADELYSVMKRDGFRKNVLVYSPPSGGKTSLLRELACRLTSGEPRRVAIVDTRYEISEGLDGSTATVLSGYPRAKGMEIAVRTLSPEIVICDEISTKEDLEAVSFVRGSGAAVVASCHSENAASARRRSGGLFEVLYGVSKSGRGVITADELPEEESA